MEEKTVTIPAISCRHCTATIIRELGELPGVDAINADQETKRVTVRWQPPATWAQIVSTLTEIGYPPGK